MSFPTELETLIRARYPILYVVTSEEMRVQNLVIERGERTPLACGLRRRAANVVPQTFHSGPTETRWLDEADGATPSVARETRALPQLNCVTSVLDSLQNVHELPIRT